MAKWKFNCPGLGQVEFVKYAVHELGFMIKGKPVEIEGLNGTIAPDGDFVITYKGKRCR